MRQLAIEPQYSDASVTRMKRVSDRSRAARI
jgi:hypothetical protein